MKISKILEKIDEVRCIWWSFSERPDIGTFQLGSGFELRVTEHKLSSGIKRRYVINYNGYPITMGYDWELFNKNLLKESRKKEEVTKLSIHDDELREKIRLKCRNDWGLDLTEDEVSMCIIEMEEQKLSLFHNQIWPNKRSYKIKNEYGRDTGQFGTRITWDKTIDGYRAIAHRSGNFSGMDAPVFSQDSEGQLVASITVYMIDRRGNRCPIVGEARFNEFVQLVPEWENKKKTGRKVPASQWSDSPHNQLAVAAERQALRKAFQECAEVSEESLADPAPVQAPEPPLIAAEPAPEESRGDSVPAASASDNGGASQPSESATHSSPSSATQPPAPSQAPETSQAQTSGPEPEPQGKYVGIPREGFQVFQMYNTQERIVLKGQRNNDWMLALDSGDKVTINADGYEIARASRQDDRKGGRNWKEGDVYYDGSKVEKIANSKKDEHALWLGLDNGFKVMVDHWGKETSRKQRKQKTEDSNPPPEQSAEPEPSTSPPPEQDVEAMNDVAQVRQATLPLLKRYCEKVLKGKKISPKEAYSQLTGVQLGRGQSMTIDDFKTLYQCLDEALVA